MMRVFLLRGVHKVEATGRRNIDFIHFAHYDFLLHAIIPSRFEK
jgi:hypothetical protein